MKPPVLHRWSRLALPTMEEVDQMPGHLRHEAMEWRRVAREAAQIPRTGHWSIERAWHLAQEDAREEQIKFWRKMADALEAELKAELEAER